MREVDDFHDPKDEREADPQQRIRAPEYQRVSYMLK